VWSTTEPQKLLFFKVLARLTWLTQTLHSWVIPYVHAVALLAAIFKVFIVLSTFKALTQDLMHHLHTKFYSTLFCQGELKTYQTTTVQVFYIHQILEKKWQYCGTVHKLLVDSKEACDSVRGKVL
jgi:hypothetical protein